MNKRLHVHISVKDLESSIRFYTSLLGRDPTVRKADYAKWRLADPAVNLAVSTGRRERHGLEHLGVEVETDAELQQIRGRLDAAHASPRSETAAECCYAVSDKEWSTDPDGIAWEIFRTYGESQALESSGCCAGAATDNAAAAAGVCC